MKLLNILTGTFVEHDILRTRGIVLMSLAVILLVYMSGIFFSYQTYDKLNLVQKELKVAQARYSVIDAERNKVTRESYLIELLDKKNIKLNRSNQPPIKIE